MKVLKFGGTSVRDADRIQQVANIVERVREHDDPELVVVVSAMGGVTDDLVRAAELASRDLDGAFCLLDQLESRHTEARDRVAVESDQVALAGSQSECFGELRETLRGISLIEECSAKTLDKVLSQGERLCAPLVAAALRQRGLESVALDTRSLIKTDRNFGCGRVDSALTAESIRQHFEQVEGTMPLMVLTGFIASSPDGHTTTLGRGGSDLTAALVGAARGAQEIQIWTDVDGVMSADPRLVSGAFSLPVLSYEELLELSHFGAKVVYPPTVLPARKEGIPLLIKNTLNPDFEGTSVVRSRPASSAHPVTGIASINEVTILRLEGDGMLGVPGIAARVFAALARDELSVILISQGSSEHSICIAVAPEHTDRAQHSLLQEFELERGVGLVRDPIVEPDQSVIAVVGEGMRERPGIAGRLFGVLGEHGLNVRAIAQGSSELNISLVVAREDERRAVRVVHDSFFGGGGDSLQVFLAGPGSIGSALLRQMAATGAGSGAPTLRLTGLSNSRRAWMSRDGISTCAGSDAEGWRSLLERHGDRLDVDRIAGFLSGTAGPKAFVDCTANESLGDLYPRLLAAGCAIVSANKLPFAGSLKSSLELSATGRQSGRGLYYEATVGAGLPVIRSLRALLDSGDRLVSIEGTLSGTLGYLLHALRNGQAFSAAIREALAAGYTEPDPREDLSGRDVARKLLILARESDLAIEPEAVAVAPLLEPSALDQLPLKEFLDQVRSVDSTFADRAAAARDRNKTLVYLARLDEEGPRVGLQEVALDHPCAGGAATDNVVAITTERYRESPLVIRGPGAGVEVTAAGVLADLLRAHAEWRSSSSSRGV